MTATAGKTENKEAYMMDAGALQALLADAKRLGGEKLYRRTLGHAAIGLGWGGISKIAELSGSDHKTIRRGIDEVRKAQAGELDLEEDAGRIRRAGGGRKKATFHNPELKTRVREIVDGKTFGDPNKVVSWTTMSLEKIAAKLREEYGITVGKDVVSTVLSDLGYSKQLNRKMLQSGEPHPDRNAQFEIINRTAQEYIEAGDPVISIDCKKKELLGNFYRDGQVYRLKGCPEKVYDHDFLIKELGRVAPCGVYDLDRNLAFINLGTSHDTAEFAVNSIYLWWKHYGQATYPHAKRLLITCDGGGSNGVRSRLWKAELAELAARLGIEIRVAHFPPGTSKWNKIEHRVFCYIAKCTAGQPFIDIETAVNLIGSTTTKTGLVVKCRHDDNRYAKGIHVLDDDIKNLNIQKLDEFPLWNYVVKGYKDPTVVFRRS